jgi:Carboxypeptidase regulatory-like domain
MKSDIRFLPEEGRVMQECKIAGSYRISDILAPTAGKKRFGVFFGLIVVMLMAGNGLMIAQVNISANLRGTVKDPSGAVVPGAQVIVMNKETGLAVKGTADPQGSFVFSSLPPGTYTLTCEVKGFKEYVSSDVILQAQQTVTLPVVLQVGATSQSVTVSAAGAMVDTATSSVQTTFSKTLVTAIPVWGRDPRQSMELLMPGAVAAGYGASYNVPVTSFNGVSGLSNNYTIDGSTTVDYFHGSATPFPASENMAEFSVTTSLPDASVAQAAGGQVNAVLKSGTNQLHGEGWGYFQNAAWNANSWQNNWLDVPRQPFSQRWYGGNVGGPVYLPKIYNGKDKTFFFTSYERTSTSQNFTTSGQTITNEERNGNFTNSPDGIPVINGVPTPIIDPATFSTMGKFLASNANVLPKPTSGLDTFTWNPSEADVTQTFVGRIDQNFGAKNRLFGSLWWYRDNPTFNDLFTSFGNAGWATQYPNPGATWGEPKKMQTWAINDTYTISPNMLNNLVVGIDRISIFVSNTYDSSNALFSASDIGCGCVGDVKAPDVQDISFPRSMGMGIYNGYIDEMTQNAFSFADNFTWVKGRNTIKMGVQFRHFHELKYQTWGAGGNLSFSDSNVNVGGSGNGVADMLLGLAPGFSQNNTQILNIYYPSKEAYAQDTIKLSRRLTVMGGIRWQPHFGIHPAEGNFVTFHAGQSSTIFPTAPVGLVTVGDQGVPPNLYGVRWADFGPHASFAWDIFGNGKAALRGGYGLFSNYQVLLGFNGYTNTAPFGVNYTPNIQTFDIAHPYAEYGSVPFPFKPPLAGDPRNATLVFPDPLNTIALSPNYNSGAIHEWNVTFEFEPFNTYLFSVGYIATRGTHLDETHDINWPQFIPGASTNDVTNVRSRRPYFPYGFETISMDNSDYNSMYNSLQVRLTKRYSYGLTLLGNYTLSSDSTQHGCRYQGSCNLDYYSPGLMQTMAAAFSYDLPIPQGQNHLSKALLGGWTIGGDATGSTGQYGAVYDYNCSEFNFGSAGCYANYVGGGAYAPNKASPVLSGGSQIGVSWLNTTNYVRADQVSVNSSPSTLPGVGQRLFLGNAIVGTYKGPAAFMLDASLNKTFALSERFKLAYRVDALNVMNHRVLNGPGNTTVAPDMSQFGAITSAWDPRRIQMSVHILF